MFEGTCECQVSEAERAAHFFVAHEYPPTICNIIRYVAQATLKDNNALIFIVKLNLEAQRLARRLELAPKFS